MRAISYSRISTIDKGQNPQVQAAELRRYCNAKGWNLVEEIVDEGYSGGTDQRPGLKRLMGLARSGEVDAIIVTKLDRLFRSLKHIVATLDEFEHLKVKFVSVSDNIDQSTASGRLMTHLIGAFSEFERALIRERTVAGLVHARNSGKKLGRPRIHDPIEIMSLRRQGLSYREISKRMKVPMGTITRAIRAAHKTSEQV